MVEPGKLEREMAKAVVFDLDGVVYKGASGIPGVAAEIFRLRKKAKVLFLTNNATKSRAQYIRSLAIFGINARASEIMTSSFGVAHYIRETYGRGRKVYVVGEQGLREELELEADALVMDGQGADIVVAGLDRHIIYGKLVQALRNLLSGAKFILANADTTYITENGLSPGSGAIAASLIYASGRKPDAVVGKPSTYLIEKLLEMHKLDPKDVAFVGDRLDIDIRMANKIGMKSVLVLTGISKKEDIARAPAGDRPDIVLESAVGVGKALKIY